MVYTIINNQIINWSATGVKRILQNVVNLLNTHIYEVAYMRLMGLSKTYIDKPLDKVEGILISEIMDLISLYEPRAKVLNVSILDYDKENEHLTIKVVVDI